MPEQPTMLRDMIRRALDSGLTLRQLADRAIDPRSGETVSKDTINKIVLGRINRIPTEEHLRALGAAIDAPYEQVRNAAIAQWLPAPDEDAERERLELIAEATRVRDQAIATLARLERQDQDQNNETDGGQRAG